MDLRKRKNKLIPYYVLSSHFNLTTLSLERANIVLRKVETQEEEFLMAGLLGIQPPTRHKEHLGP